MTSSPGPTPSDERARGAAPVVQIDTATPCSRADRASRRPARTRATRGPWATQPDAIAAAAAASASSAPSHGRMTGIGAARRRGVRRASRRAVLGGLLGLPPLDEPPQTLLEVDLGLEAEQLAGLRRCRRADAARR